MKLIKSKVFKITIKCLTGLHIGAGNEQMEIGTLDNPIIKDPRTGLPYIPGSSLKGKVRSLLEIQLDKVNKSIHAYTEDCSAEENPCPICALFGTSAGTGWPFGPSRIIFRDLFLSDEDKTLSKQLMEDGIPFTETKMEVSIPRFADGRSASKGLRSIERVPAGTSFSGTIVLRIFDHPIIDGGFGKYFSDFILEKGKQLLEMDALGGSGSRGYGQVEINIEEV